MPIDLDAALAAPARTREISWTDRDVLLYHLSLGAGSDAPERPDLRLTFERDLAVLPTFAMVAGQGISAGVLPAASMELPGVDVDLRSVLHGGQALEVHRPLPPSGSATVSTRISDIWEKGSAAVVALRHDACDERGSALWTSTMHIWVRGEGGFGGPWMPTAEDEAVPPGAADYERVVTTRGDQALLYRLNGDLNPLHADPAFAAAAGFDVPILHGLASFGVTARVVVEDLLGSDAHRLTSFAARFAGTVVPGEELRVRAWWRDEELMLGVDCPARDGAPVLTHARMGVRR